MVGIFIGKFLPPHRGHITTILQSYTLCDELYVIVSERKKEDGDLCASSHTPYMPGSLRKNWLSQELSNFDNIFIKYIDESDLPPPPYGWEEYTNRINKLVGKPIDLIFGGEPDYAEHYSKHFPNSKYHIIDPARSRWNISGTKVRADIYGNWDYLVGSARPFFAKKVLIAGTESTGKTTLTKALAKIYNTSWSEEVGRYYASRYLGGDETIYTEEDFKRIAHLQYESDYDALRHANKVSFFDTDAVATQYFCELYLNKRLSVIEEYIDPYRYDLVLFLTPDVKWVDDGMRLHGGAEERKLLSDRLLSYYQVYGYNNISIIRGDYNTRLATAMDLVSNLLRS